MDHLVKESKEQPEEVRQFIMVFCFFKRQSDRRLLGISTTEIKRLVNYWNSGPTKLRDCWNSGPTKLRDCWNFWNYRVSRIARALGCWVLVLWELGSLGPPGL